MSRLNEDYYVLERPSNSSIPLLKADKDTSSKKYWSLDYQFDGRPLVFSNKKKKKNLEVGVVEHIASILFTPDAVVVSEEINDILSNFDIDGIDLIPAIYIANDGSWHEVYSYVKIKNEFDFWCRNASEYNPEPRSSTGWHYVYKYVLDADLVERVPLESRLLFNMGGVSMPVICLHSSLVEEITKNTNAMSDFFIPLSEYEG